MVLPLIKTSAISVTAFIYIIHLILNGLAAKGGNDLFPKSAADASKEFHLEITPIGATFSIWGLIFAFQLAWIIYLISTIFRKGSATNILSTRFYVCFVLNILLITTWLFLWSRLRSLECLIDIVIGQVFLNISFAFACVDLKNFLSVPENGKVSTLDIWCQRILVQNSLLFYATWTTVATLINVAIVLAYKVGIATKTASLISLSILGILVVSWFILENFVLKEYTQYTLSAYISLIYALTGVFVNNADKSEIVSVIVLALLILSIGFLLARIFILIFRKPPTVKTDVHPSAVYHRWQFFFFFFYSFFFYHFMVVFFK